MQVIGAHVAISDPRSRGGLRSYTPGPMRRRLFPIALLLGCASAERMYDGPARARSEVARIQGVVDYVGASVQVDVRIVAVDGRSTTRGGRRVAVLPGTRMVEIMWSRLVYEEDEIDRGSWRAAASGFETTTLTTRPGQTYRLSWQRVQEGVYGLSVGCELPE